VQTPARLAACEIGDDLGGLGFGLLWLPLLCAVLGTCAGVAVHRVPPSQAGESRQATLVPPVAFCLITTALAAIVLALNLW
jgi:hypothetical protein